MQAGHNDMGVPAAVETLRVKQAIAQIRAAAPDAGIALITVFVGPLHRPAAYQTDRTIVAAARAADPAVIIMDPLAGKWKFARIRDGLHPSAAGSQWIAGEVGQTLVSRGVHPMPVARGADAEPGGHWPARSATTASRRPRPCARPRLTRFPWRCGSGDGQRGLRRGA